MIELFRLVYSRTSIALGEGVIFINLVVEVQMYPALGRVYGNNKLRF
jgi:hypothetical protein